MTREEAIAFFKDMNECTYGNLEAVEMAIQALSQEPTKREIEREYLFQSLCEDFKKLQAENDDLRKRLEQEPCDDAISRHKAIVMITAYEGKSAQIEALEQLPSVNPQKSGKWIDYRDDGFVECPFCGRATNCEDDIDELHYCFFCGAELSGEEQTE